MNEIEFYNQITGMVIPRETVRNSCYVSTPKQMFISLMAGERVCFKEYNTAAKYYIRAAEIFRSLYAANMTDYEFVVALNNYIVQHIQYDYSVLGKTGYTADDMESFEIDAPLFKGKGVCSAKSKFFSLLCCLANIKTVLVTGSLKSSKRDARHAWNKVYLKKPGDTEAKWWNIDTTNNRVHGAQLDVDCGDYFLVDDCRIMRTHFFMDYPDTSEYKQINFAATGSFDYPIS
jgi:transglutaminase/protease-like cytokinesis protein 3